MGRPRLPIAPHLSHEEIAAGYRACRHPVGKIHWQEIQPELGKDRRIVPSGHELVRAGR